MSRHRLRIRALIVAVAVCLFAPQLAGAAEPGADAASPYVTKSIRGRVVWLAEAMNRLQGTKAVPEARDRILALETDDGQLHPIVEDIRGRAFRRDQRLREMQVELLVRQYRSAPLVQIVRVFELTEDGKSEIDYWCEICSIAMFELKECECCQGPIELRRQPVERP